MRCTCEKAAREARNEALREAAEAVRNDYGSCGERSDYGAGMDAMQERAVEIIMALIDTPRAEPPRTKGDPHA